MLVSHIYCRGGKIIDCSGCDTKYTNHSSRPTTGFNTNDPNDHHTYALRDIAAGEELTEDYGTYMTDSVPFYAKLCAQYGVMTTDEIAQKYSSVVPFVDGSRSALS